MKPTDLQKNELMEIMKLGYWPVKFLEEQRHWIAEGDTVDDCGTAGYIENPRDICGYEFKCWIADSIAVNLVVLQGNVSEIDGNSQLEFSVYNMDTGDTIAQQLYPVTGTDQVIKLVDAEWEKFITSTWPLVCTEFEKIMDHYKDRCADRDAEIHHGLSLFVWQNFNAKLRDDLVNGLFYDWSALDTIEKWIKK